MQDFVHWLFEKTNSSDNQTQKDLLDLLFYEMIHTIQAMEDVSINHELTEIQHLFYVFSYHKDLIQFKEMDLYFDLKYNDSIVDLFMRFQDISRSFGSLLFQTRDDNAYHLLTFINHIVEIHEYDEEDDSIIFQNDEEMY